MNVTLDKAGRVVIPNGCASSCIWRPEAPWNWKSEGHSVTLRPVRPHALLKKEHGV